MPAKYGGAAALASVAARLGGPRAGPALFLFTDPDRLADPVRAAAALPPGSGVVYRHFGKPGRAGEARRLQAVCADGGHVLLIAADPDLAAAIGADGVHWPEWSLGAARRGVTARFALNSAAAHSPAAVRRAARTGMDMAFVSPAFPSRSPGAGRALGPLRLRALAAQSPLPLYALGGIGRVTARRLENSGLSGLAAIEALAGTDA